MKADVTGLIADIGATNARFALADRNGIYHERVLKCGDYASLVQAVQAYLVEVKTSSPPRTAAVAIAGPVVGDRFEMTNHAWSFSVEETRRALGLSSFRLLNDFEALALAVPHLKDKDVRRLGGGDKLPAAPIGIIGPGTGLGVASLIWDGARYCAVPGEGGHVTMPARTQREFDVFQELVREKYSHVSAERVCSGKGLHNIYTALRALSGDKTLTDLTPEEISARALARSCSVCMEALEMMIRFLGRVAGNLALTLGTYGGIYIAGGIIGQLGGYLDHSPLLSEFVEKGRFKSYMEAVPLFLIEHPFPAFIGLQADLINTSL